MEHQSHRSSEKNSERKWRSRETSSATNDYCEPKQRSHYQPAPYNELKSIFMVELHKTLLDIMRMKGVKWVFNVTVIVEYQPPP